VATTADAKQGLRWLRLLSVWRLPKRASLCVLSVVRISLMDDVGRIGGRVSQRKTRVASQTFPSSGPASHRQRARGCAGDCCGRQLVTCSLEVRWPLRPSFKCARAEPFNLSSHSCACVVEAEECEAGPGFSAAARVRSVLCQGEKGTREVTESIDAQCAS
jgi:hypothetical protein